MAKAKPKVALLKRRLKAHGITQVAIARAAGVSPIHVCNVLAGRDQSRKVVAVALSMLHEVIEPVAG